MFFVIRIRFSSQLGYSVLDQVCFRILCSYHQIVSFIFYFQLKEFILNEPEAYEVKIGDQVFRRPGDPPLEEVIEMLRNEKIKEKNDTPRKEEL